MCDQLEYVKVGKHNCIKRNCAYCGAEFGANLGNVRKGMGIYCSLTCARRGMGNRVPETRTCKTCHVEFQVSPAKKSRGYYCSQQCYWNSLKLEVKPRACDHCGKVVDILPYRQKRKSFMCSLKCRNEHNRHGRYVECENPECTKIVYRGDWTFKINKHHFCSFKCRSAVVNGPNHHLWVGGLGSHIKRQGHEFTHHQKRLILERDSYTCRGCGDDQADALHIDHIQAICLGGTNNLENGQTLCEGCHNKKTTQDRTVLRCQKAA